METSPLRVFCIGDPHFTIKHLENGKEFATKTIAMAKEKAPDIIIDFGDTTDEHEICDTAVLEVVTDFLHELSLIAPLYIIMGNHDLPNKLMMFSRQHAFNAMKYWKNTYVIDKPLVTTIKDERFIFMPFVPPGRFIEGLNQTGIDWTTNITAIFAHQEIYGCKQNGDNVISVFGDKWLPSYPAVISGHIHQAQKVGNNVLYIGSPYQLEFVSTGNAEKDRKTLWVIHFNDHAITQFDRFDLGMRCKKTVMVESLEEVSKVTKQENEEVMVVVEGEYSELLNFGDRVAVKEAEARGVKVKKREVGKVKKTVEVEKLKKGYAAALYELIDADLKELFIEVIGPLS